MLTTLNSELASSGRFNTFDYTRGRDLWEKVPPFDYDVPAARWALSQRRGAPRRWRRGWSPSAIAAGVVGVVDEARVAMVWFLARHEWRVLTASAIVRLVLAVFAIALLVASGDRRDARGARARDRSTSSSIAAASSKAAQPVSLRADVDCERARLAGVTAAGAAQRAGSRPGRRLSELHQGHRAIARCAGQRRSDRASAGGGERAIRRRVRGPVPLSAADLRDQLRPDRHRARSRHAADGAGAAGDAARGGRRQDDRASGRSCSSR